MPYRLDIFIRLVPLLLLSAVLAGQTIFDPETGQRIDLEFELEAYDPDTGEMYYTAEEVMQFAKDDVHSYYTSGKRYWFGMSAGYAAIISPMAVIGPAAEIYGDEDDVPALVNLIALSMYYVIPKLLALPNARKIPKGIAYYSKKISPGHRELYLKQIKIEERKVKRKAIRSGVLGWLLTTAIFIISVADFDDDMPDQESNLY